MTLINGTIQIDSDTDDIRGNFGSTGVFGIASSATPFTLAVIGSSPNANGATLSAGTFNLQPADGSNGGVLSNTTQSWLGNKTNIGTFTTALTGIDRLTLSANSGENGLKALVSGGGLYLAATAGVVTIKPTDGTPSSYTTFAANGEVAFSGAVTSPNFYSGTVTPFSSSSNFQAREAITTHAQYAFEDGSLIDYAAPGVLGHASFFDNVDIEGTVSSDHHHGFQSSATVNLTGATLTELAAFYAGMGVSAGTVTTAAGVKIIDIQGAGTVTNNIGLDIASLTRGGTLNYAIRTGGTTPSLFGGFISAPSLRLPNAGFVTFRNAANSADRTALSFNGSDKIIIGEDTDISAIGFGTTSELMLLNSSGLTLTSLAGTGSRTVLADANGVLSAPVSDLSVKQSIKPLHYGLKEILRMRPIEFEYIDGWKNYGEGKQIGNGAQDIAKIIPEATFVTPSTGKMGINYEQLHGVYIKAIQELNEKITALEKK